MTNHGGQQDGMAAVAQAQASVAAGSVGSSNGLGATTGAGGCCWWRWGDTGTGNGNGNSDGDSDTNGTGGQYGIGTNAIPEPMTAIVWSILALCGVGMIRVFRH